MRKAFTHLLTAFLFLLSFTASATPAITGPDTLCAGTTATLADATPIGTWSSSDTAIATIDTFTGIVTGVRTGTATIFYTTGGTPDTIALTVLPLPDAGTITGADSICSGLPITLNNTVTGGVWFSRRISDTVVNGMVTGAAVGIDTVFYRVSSMCGNDTVLHAVNIKQAPSDILGWDFICNTRPTTTLADSVSGGIWSSSDSTIIAIDSATGFVQPGSTEIDRFEDETVTITYTLPTGCFTTRTEYIYICEAVPVIGITNDRITLFPNPANTMLNLTAANDVNTVVITDPMGKILYTRHSNSNIEQIDISGLPVGIYFLKANDIAVKRFVKQ